jgi:fibronectin-binding autotransporter adhesin
MTRHSHSSGLHPAEHSLDNAASGAPITQPDADNWQGDPGANGDGDWNTPADWSSGTVPDASASVTFATGNFGYTVTGDATIGAITVDGDGVTFDGVITQDTGDASPFLTALDGGFVTLDANSFFDGGALDFTAGSFLDAQGLLLVNGGTADQMVVEGLSGTVVTSSAIDLNGLYVNTGASFTGDVTLNDGGNITLDTSALFGGGSITLLGTGTIYEALAPGAGAGNAGIGDAVAIAAGGTLILASDPGVAFAVSGPITGAGGVLVNGGSVELTGVNSYTGSTSVENGTLIADGPGAVPGGLITLSDAALTTQPDSTGAVNFTDSVVGYGTSDTVNAIAGNLLVFAGGAGSFSFIGGAASDTVVGDAGALSVIGGSAGDLIYGGAGSLNFTGGNFTGGSGGSTVIGAAGVVSATGGAAGDLIFGGTSGQDILYTGAGAATLVGGAGAQLYATGSANSVLVDGANGSGGAVLSASASTGNDTLFGGIAGTSDTITSSAGTSAVVLNGGATELFTAGTADVFAGAGVLTLAYVSGGPSGTTNVDGFNAATDQISLSGFAQGAAAQILASETITGGSTVLHIGNDQVVLFGVTNLTGANFA